MSGLNGHIPVTDNLRLILFGARAFGSYRLKVRDAVDCRSFSRITSDLCFRGAGDKLLERSINRPV